MKRMMLAGWLLAAVACGGEGETESGRAAEAFCAEVRPAVEAYLEEARARNPVPDDERYGGTAVVGGQGEIPDPMNSLVTSDYVAQQYQQFVGLMTLVRYDEDYRPVPYLAESWEVSEDTTAVTFHLRDDVFWHDGERTDAHDVAFTYRRVTDPATGYPNAAYWDFYEKGEGAVEVIDDFTVTLRLQPHADFMDPWRALGIMPEHLLADVPAEEVANHPIGSVCPVGNGPFAFVSHTPNDRWVFEANPAFPEALGGRPYLDRLVYRVIPEQTTLLAELLTGGLDLYVAVLPDQARDIVEARDVELRSFEFRNVVFVGWNARRPVLSDPRVRRALTMAVDRQQIVDHSLQGFGRVAESGVPPFHWAFDPDAVPATPYDPDGARSLLAEAGWTDREGDGVRENARGEDLTFSLKYHPGNQVREDIAEIMQAQLAEVGVDLELRVVEWLTLQDQVFFSPPPREFDGVVMAWVADFRLDEADLFHSERVDGPWNMSGTENPELDRLLDTLQLVLDRERARELWNEYQRVLVEEHPYTYFYFPERLDGVSRRLEGVELDARGEWVSVRDWWIDPDQR